MSNGYEFGIHVFVRDDVIVEICCKVGSQFVCPTDIPLFCIVFVFTFTLWVTECISVVVDKICDIYSFLFSFSVLYLFSELECLYSVICIACSSGTILSFQVFETDACVRLRFSLLVSFSGIFSDFYYVFQNIVHFVFTDRSRKNNCSSFLGFTLFVTTARYKG